MTPPTDPTDPIDPIDPIDPTDPTDPMSHPVNQPLTDATELRLRKALGAVNDLEPPRDDLFVQRALLRGRARTHRRRGAVLGAAAGIAVVGAVGVPLVINAWNGGSQTNATSGSLGGSYAESRDQSAGKGATGGGAPEVPSGPPSASGLPSVAVGVPPARDTNGWLSGVMSPQRIAFDQVAATLAADHADVFGGAYATDASNTHIVVTVTRHDPALESLVSGAMPSPGDVSFAVVDHTASAKEKAAAQIRTDAPAWAKQGVMIEQVRIDARADRVVVTLSPRPSGGTADRAAQALPQRYGTGLVVVVRGLSIDNPATTGAPATPSGPELSIPTTPSN